MLFWSLASSLNVTVIGYVAQVYILLHGRIATSFILDGVYYLWFLSLVFKDHAVYCRYKWEIKKHYMISLTELRLITLLEIPCELILFTITLVIYEQYLKVSLVIIFIYVGLISALFRQVYVLKKTFPR